MTTQTNSSGTSSARNTASFTVAPLLSTRCCLFLDIDGTLLDFAATPGSVLVDTELVELLAALMLRLDGAVGLISGRPVSDLDRLFDPLTLPAAGVHGAERRDAAGVLYREQLKTDVLANAKIKLQGFVACHRGLLLEDKQFGLAVHYRRAPHHQELVRLMVEHIAATLTPDFRSLEGDRVLEIKPAACTKGTAIEAFLREPPFVGRLPVFIGDDVTDRDGFSVVERNGGMSIAVGDRVQARWKLPSPAAVRSWLASFVQAGGH